LTACLSPPRLLEQFAVGDDHRRHAITSAPPQRAANIGLVIAVEQHRVGPERRQPLGDLGAARPAWAGLLAGAGIFQEFVRIAAEHFHVPGNLRVHFLVEIRLNPDRRAEDQMDVEILARGERTVEGDEMLDRMGDDDRQPLGGSHEFGSAILSR
jgi:hypothetical protein